MLQRHLAPAGFEVQRPVFSEPGSEPVENFFAAIGGASGISTLAGHVDVVPPGDVSSWRHPPFAAEIVDGVLYGRGAVDMKGGLAAMLAAALRFVAEHGGNFGGRLSFLVTGDEEGAGGQRHGQAARLGGGARRAVQRGAWSASRQAAPSLAIRSRSAGAAVIPRRSSWRGQQGHAAYPELADNPVRGLTSCCMRCRRSRSTPARSISGPSTLEVVSVDVGNPAWNVIPGGGDGALQQPLQRLLDTEQPAGRRSSGGSPRRPPIRRFCQDADPLAARSGAASADVFLTRDEALIELVSDAIEKVAGRRPELSTSGGTSDARFIKDYCPVVEFGPVGKSMHQVDEHVPLAEIERAAAIYYEEFLAHISSGDEHAFAYLRDNLAGAWQVMLGRRQGLRPSGYFAGGFLAVVRGDRARRCPSLPSSLLSERPLHRKPHQPSD